MRDQDSKGNCYAQGTADQLTHWMITHSGRGIDISRENMVSAPAITHDAEQEDRPQAYGQLAAQIQLSQTFQARIDQITKRLDKINETKEL